MKEKKSFTTKVGNGLGNGIKRTILDPDEKRKETTIKDSATPINAKRNLVYNNQTGLFDTRVTLVMEEGIYEKTKRMAHWERVKIKDIINASIQKTIREHEKLHGELLPIPEKIKPSSEPE